MYRFEAIVNELTGFGQGAGQAHWIDPNYDPAGNMASGPRGDAPTTRLHFKWDAWNRLCEVRADSNGSPGTPGDLIASYRYDGRDVAPAMRRHESTGRPLGDVKFLKKIGRLLGRDLVPRKPGPAPRKKGKHARLVLCPPIS